MAEEKIRRLFLCRHGETEANVQKIYCGGNRESPLNENGKNQAMLLGKTLKNYYKFQGKFIFSSARQRTQKTADIISKQFKPKLNKINMEGLRELELGEWCGKTAEEIMKIWPKEYEIWLKAQLSPDFRFPGGESIKEATERIEKCFNLIKDVWLWLDFEDESNNDLIIVAHGGVNIIILMKILGIEKCIIRAIRQDNACVNIIGFREKNIWRPPEQIILVNATHHLSP
jgi:probable phosphoglycerate mutase